MTSGSWKYTSAVLKTDSTKRINSKWVLESHLQEFSAM